MFTTRASIMLNEMCVYVHVCVCVFLSSASASRSLYCLALPALALALEHRRRASASTPLPPRPRLKRSIPELSDALYEGSIIRSPKVSSMYAMPPYEAVSLPTRCRRVPCALLDASLASTVGICLPLTDLPQVPHTCPSYMLFPRGTPNS